MMMTDNIEQEKYFDMTLFYFVRLLVKVLFSSSSSCVGAVAIFLNHVWQPMASSGIQSRCKYSKYVYETLSDLFALVVKPRSIF